MNRIRVTHNLTLNLTLSEVMLFKDRDATVMTGHRQSNGANLCTIGVRCQGGHGSDISYRM